MNSILVDSGDISIESERLSCSLPNEINCSIETLIHNYDKYFVSSNRSLLSPCKCEFFGQIYPQLLLVEINSCRSSINLLLPQSTQQFNLSRIYCPKLIDWNYSKNRFQIPSIFTRKSTIIQFQSNSILLISCSILGLLLSKYGSFSLDFLLISICISSILVVIYEKWSKTSDN